MLLQLITHLTNYKGTKSKKSESQISRQVRILLEGDKDSGRKRDIEPIRTKHASRFHIETNSLLFI